MLLDVLLCVGDLLLRVLVWVVMIRLFCEFIVLLWR